jgi:hypothetical protein
MTSIRRAIARASRPLQTLGLCVLAGLIAGILAGVILSLLDLGHGGITPTHTESLLLALMLTVFCWLWLLFAFVLMARMPFLSVAYKALATTALVVALTIALSELVGSYRWAWLMGAFAGLLVGYLLCRLSRLFAGDTSNAMH